jgi:hypothetical protein
MLEALGRHCHALRVLEVPRQGGVLQHVGVQLRDLVQAVIVSGIRIERRHRALRDTARGQQADRALAERLCQTMKGRGLVDRPAVGWIAQRTVVIIECVDLANRIHFTHRSS